MSSRGLVNLLVGHCVYAMTWLESSGKQCESKADSPITSRVARIIHVLLVVTCEMLCWMEYSDAGKCRIGMSEFYW